MPSLTSVCMAVMGSRRETASRQADKYNTALSWHEMVGCCSRGEEGRVWKVDMEVIEGTVRRSKGMDD